MSCVSCCAAGCEKRTVPVGATRATAGPRWSSGGHGHDECGWHSGDHRLSSLSVSCLVLNEQPPSLLWMLLWSSVSLGLLLPSKPTMSTSSGTRETTVSPCVREGTTRHIHKTVHVGFQWNHTINTTHGMGNSIIKKQLCLWETSTQPIFICKQQLHGCHTCSVAVLR